MNIFTKFAVVLLVVPFSLAACEQSETDWATSHSMAEISSEISNSIKVQESGLLWNGEAISDQHFNITLDVLAAEFSPKPLLVVSPEPGVEQAKIDRVKMLIDEKIGCEPSICVELVAS